MYLLPIDKESPVEGKEEVAKGNVEDFEDSSDDDEIISSLLEVGSRKNNVNNRIQAKLMPNESNSIQYGKMNVDSVSSIPLKLPNASSIITDGENEIKKFCQEGTPSWMSKSNSNTNLSILSINDVKQPESKKNSDDRENIGNKIVSSKFRH